VFRPKLFRISHEDHVLVLMAHHIVADGWSLRIFMKDLGLLCRSSVGPTRPFMPIFAASGRTSEGLCFSSEARR
jgi:hypothetical protein